VPAAIKGLRSLAPHGRAWRPSPHELSPHELSPHELDSSGAHHFQIVLVLIPSVIVGIGWGALVMQEMACVQRGDDGVER